MRGTRPAVPCAPFRARHSHLRGARPTSALPTTHAPRLERVTARVSSAERGAPARGEPGCASQPPAATAHLACAFAEALEKASHAVHGWRCSKRLAWPWARVASTKDDGRRGRSPPATAKIQVPDLNVRRTCLECRSRPMRQSVNLLNLRNATSPRGAPPFTLSGIHALRWTVGRTRPSWTKNQRTSLTGALARPRPHSPEYVSTFSEASAGGVACFLLRGERTHAWIRHRWRASSRSPRSTPRPTTAR